MMGLLVALLQIAALTPGVMPSHTHHPAAAAAIAN